jgi:thioredoxin reductase
MLDTIIVGAGCAGLAAAMNAGRVNMKTKLIGENTGIIDIGQPIDPPAPFIIKMNLYAL